VVTLLLCSGYLWMCVWIYSGDTFGVLWLSLDVRLDILW
jgi:hypothetical protein